MTWYTLDILIRKKEINMFMMIYAMVMGLIGWYIGGAKNRPVLGSVLGVAFGPIGLLIDLIIPVKEY